jgi:hypothetical protein
MTRAEHEWKKPILLDVDGVLCGFNEHTTKLARERGYNVTANDCKGDCRKEAWWHDSGLEHEWTQPGFCASLPMLSGSQKFVEDLRKLDRRVMFLTSPPKDNPTWPHERRLWLEKNYGAKRVDVMFAVDKRYVNGVFFVDDHIKNILDWQKYQREAGVLIARPWNEEILNDCVIESSSLILKGYNLKEVQVLDHQKRDMTVIRTPNYDDIVELARLVIDKENLYFPPSEEVAS